MIPHVPFVHLVWERLFDDHFLPHLVFFGNTLKLKMLFSFLEALPMSYHNSSQQVMVTRSNELW